MAGHHPPGDLAWKIETGRRAMPAWKGILTKNEIWDLVNFIRALK
jgi:mono/diheme cytochrome c family protein